MPKRVRIIILIFISIMLQTAFFPAHLTESFRPNLLIMFVVYMGFRESGQWGGFGSFLLGLVQDSLSGHYFGLYGFLFLLTFIILKTISHRLYTDSRILMVLTVFLVTIFNGFMILLLLNVFSVGEGIYSTIFSAILLHGTVNAAAAGLFFGLFLPVKREELG